MYDKHVDSDEEGKGWISSTSLLLLQLLLSSLWDVGSVAFVYPTSKSRVIWVAYPADWLPFPLPVALSHPGEMTASQQGEHIDNHIEELHKLLLSKKARAEVLGNKNLFHAISSPHSVPLFIYWQTSPIDILYLGLRYILLEHCPSGCYVNPFTLAAPHIRNGTITVLL